jgi:hypothetical protein
MRRVEKLLLKLLVLVAGATGIVAIILLIWKVPQYQAKDIDNAKDRVTVENTARGTLVQAFGGLFLFVTAYFSYQNIKVAQKNLEAIQRKQDEDAKVAQANLKVAEEKQVTERFAKAVEQLGNDNIHIRLGAIYALERIANDSDKDYWQVMEILTAYVRERAPYPPKNENNQPLWAATLSIHRSESESTPANVSPVTTDIQAVLTVISRRTKRHRLSKRCNYPCNIRLNQINIAFPCCPINNTVQRGTRIL